MLKKRTKQHLCEMNNLLESLLERGVLKGFCTVHAEDLFRIHTRRASHSAHFD